MSINSDFAKRRPRMTISDTGRLPTNVKPVHYNLQLETDLARYTFGGAVAINIEVIEDTNSILLNTVELKITKAEIYTENENSSCSASVTSEEKDETSRFDLPDVLRAGSRATLRVEFAGILRDQASGFYRAAYNGKHGSTEWCAVTQFQATDARRAFPCFDEPGLKATFAMTLVAQKEMVCLSNMDVKSVAAGGFDITGKPLQATRFNTTPPMASYLLAFAVGKFNHVQVDSFRVPIRVYVTPDLDVNTGIYSAELTAKTLAFYEKQFRVDYPLPKLDLLGVAGKNGAMENWGLIMFQERALLVNEKTGEAKTKFSVTSVVQHEEAHLWFGDLVTMDWWQGLWLNESFADWASSYSGNYFNPNWQIWNDFVTDSLQKALTLDSLRSSHPIEVPVSTPDQINQVFDSISYAKGCSVLRMLATYLGEDDFVKGVGAYLRKHAYGNTKTIDLWKDLGDSTGKDVEEIMQIWTKNIGYPLVTVEEDEASGLVHLRQNRYLRNGDSKPDDDTVLWPVFLAIKTKHGINSQAIFRDREVIYKPKSLDFFKINAEHTGVYRTLYTAKRLEALGTAAQSGKLTVADRAGLMSDSVALSASGHQLMASTFGLVKALSSDKSFYVWRSITSWFTALRSAWMFAPLSFKKAMTAAERHFTSAKAHEIGWTFDTIAKDDIVAPQFKQLMFTTAGLAGDYRINHAAKAMFDKFAAGDSTALNPNLRAACFSMAVKFGGVKQYDIVLAAVRSARNQEERMSSIGALGYATSAGLIKRSIELIFDTSVPFKDLGPLYQGLNSHPAGVQALFEVVTKRFDELRERVPGRLLGLSSVFDRLLDGLATEEQRSQLAALFEEKDISAFDKVFQQRLEEIEVRTNWVARSGQELKEWLVQEGYLVEDSTLS